ncbi:hypothetical protein AMS60_16180 [Bacillus sp. FJAT-21945]|nr:hypothetical protein AMS60_16180 [Bacillus sp. FJAT-21945]
MSNEYVISVANKYKVDEEVDYYTQCFIINPLTSLIREWAGDRLNNIYLSGSRSKNTAISLSSDLDLFISIKSDTDNTLRQIYESLNGFFKYKGYKTREQNVSIGIEIGGKKVDLVPAKKRPGNTNYHSLYLSKKGSWTQTNILEHIRIVKNSGRTTEIILLKIWRELHGLSFPSIYLELTVIEALKSKSKNNPSGNFLTVLQYLRDEFINKTFIDPANTNNVISDDLYKYEKEAIRKKANDSLSQQYWEDIIW